MFHFVVTVQDIIGAAALLFIIGIIIFCKLCDWQHKRQDQKVQENETKSERSKNDVRK